MKIYIFCLIYLLSPHVWGQDGCYKRIYLDRQRNVRLVTSTGRDVQLSKGGRATRAALSDDRRTVSWLIENSWTAEGDDGPGSSELNVYRDGKAHHIKCGPFIREYWFWQDGKQIVIFCGGRHFAGTFSLYDAANGELIEFLHQTDISEEQRPAWSLPGHSYHPEDIH